jgi:hypothetical protein
MSIFDDLREACATWNQRYNDYKIQSVQFAWNFAEEFRQYTGAPPSYVDIDRSTKRYIELAKAVLQEDGGFSFEQPRFHTDALDRDENGYWITGLRITVDRAPNSYPKMYFVVFLRFVVRENRCEMEIGFEPKRFTFDLANSDQVKPAYDYIIGIMHSIFAMPPWEANQKSPIGFVPSQSS